MTHVCRGGHWTCRRPSQASVFPPVRAGSHGPCPDAQHSHRRVPGPGRISRLTRAERPREGARDTEGRRQGFKVSGGLSGASQPPAHMRVCTMLWGPRDIMESSSLWPPRPPQPPPRLTPATSTDLAQPPSLSPCPAGTPPGWGSQAEMGEAGLAIPMDGTLAPATPSHARQRDEGPERGTAFPRVTQQGQRQKEEGAGLGQS